MDKVTHRASINNPVVRSGAPLPMLPTGDRVAVERLDPDEETVAGIIIPGVDKEKNLYATIVAAGLLALDVLHDHNIGIGDTVCIGRYSGVVWDFRPKGTMQNERVDIVNVKDIYGSVEMVEKVMSGEIEIGLKTDSDGQRRHRYWRRLTDEEMTPEEHADRELSAAMSDEEPTEPERPSNHVPKEAA